MNHSSLKGARCIQGIWYAQPPPGVDDEDEEENQKKGCFSFLNHRVHKKALEEHQDKGQAVYSSDRSQLKKPEIFILTVAQKAPWESGQEMSENVFERDPQKRSEKERKVWIYLPDFSKTNGEEGPKKGQIQDKNNIDEEAHSYGKVAIVSRDIRDPVDQDGVEGKASNQAENKGLFGSLLSEDKKERNERNPCKKGEVELRKGQCSQNAAEYD